MHIESIHSLADSAKSLAKVVESLKKNCNAATPSTSPTPSNPTTFRTYADIMATNLNSNNSNSNPSTPTYNPDTPEYITR